jgi:hypothetical protein
MPVTWFEWALAHAKNPFSHKKPSMHQACVPWNAAGVASEMVDVLGGH